MNRTRTMLIVGASLAGAKAAETLRQEGFDGRVVLIGEEPERPYERPPLSKDYLRGEGEPSYVHDEGFYAEHGIELRTDTRVAAIDRATSEVVLVGGERLAYDCLLLTTGATPVRLVVPGADLPGIHYLRSVADADALSSAIRQANRVAVVGAGWIGSEVVASARQMGAEVALIGPGSTPLESTLGPAVGAVYRDLHAEHGVELHLGSVVEAIVGGGRAEGVRTADGRVIEADLIVVGIGAAPRVELAWAAGLAVDGGIVVDEYLKTSAPDIYAAGDVALAWHPRLGLRLRVEHWANARHQGPVAARNMLGSVTPYERIPYFFSDQYDLGMEYTGYASRRDEVVFRGEPASREFIAFWLRDGRVVAGMNANVWDVAGSIAELVRIRRPVDVSRLVDPDVALDDLVAIGSIRG